MIFFLDLLNIANPVFVKAAGKRNMLRISDINRRLDNVIHRAIQFYRTVGMRKMADITLEMKDINQMQNTSSYKMIYIQI